MAGGIGGPAWDKQCPLLSGVRDAAAAFVETQRKLADHLERKTTFLLYSEGGVSAKAAALLNTAGILVVDVAKLAAFEMPSR